MANGTNSADSAKVGEGGNSGTKPVHAKRHVLAMLAVLPVFFAAAALVSWQLQNQDHTEEVNNAAPAEPKNPVKTSLLPVNPVELLARADYALRQHRFAAALALYEDLRAASADHGPFIVYRHALCLESVGKVDLAMAGFRTSISILPSPALLFAGHLGLARCLFRQGQFAECRRLLYPFLFDESRQRDIPRAFAADARYLIALALSREAMQQGETNKKAEGPVSVSTIGLEIPYYLDEVAAPAIATTGNNAGSAAEKGKKKDVKQDRKEEKADTSTKPLPQAPLPPSASAPQTLLVQKMDMNRSVVEVLESLSAQSKVPIKLSTNARKVLAERSLRLLLQNPQLDDVLEWIADNFGLVCQADGTSRQIVASSEMAAKQLSTLRRDRAMRALRGVLLSDAGHPWAAAACLELGNWETSLGKLPEGAGWFERLAREAPNSPYVPAAYFNLALVQLDRQDAVAGRIALFRVIDHSPGHELAVKAYFRIGMSYMEDEEFKQAIVQLRHAQVMTPKSVWHGHTTVALAAAYVFNNQPDKARSTLAKERDMLQKNPCKTTAAFLDAYAQYQLAKETSPARREASDLLATLWRDQDKTVLGPLGDRLVAQAYRDLGFWSHAEQILSRTNPVAQGTLAKAIEYLHADTLMKMQRREEATKLFEKLAVAPSIYRPQARLQLAQVKLHDKQFKECADICGELWKERAGLDSQAVLQVWGTALEGIGEFAKAAQCYSGKPPE